MLQIKIYGLKENLDTVKAELNDETSKIIDTSVISVRQYPRTYPQM